MSKIDISVDNKNKHIENNEYQESINNNDDKEIVRIYNDLNSIEEISNKNNCRKEHLPIFKKNKNELVVQLSPKKKNDNNLSISNKNKFKECEVSFFTNKSRFNMTNLDVLKKSNLGKKRRNLLSADFDFSKTNKKYNDDVIVRIEIGTTGEDFNSLFREIQKLLN